MKLKLSCINRGHWSDAFLYRKSRQPWGKNPLDFSSLLVLFVASYTNFSHCVVESAHVMKRQRRKFATIVSLTFGSIYKWSDSASFYFSSADWMPVATQDKVLCTSTSIHLILQLTFCSTDCFSQVRRMPMSNQRKGYKCWDQEKKWALPPYITAGP